MKLQSNFCFALPAKKQCWVASTNPSESSLPTLPSYSVRCWSCPLSCLLIGDGTESLVDRNQIFNVGNHTFRPVSAFQIPPSSWGQESNANCKLPSSYCTHAYTPSNQQAKRTHNESYQLHQCMWHKRMQLREAIKMSSSQLELLQVCHGGNNEESNFSLL